MLPNYFAELVLVTSVALPDEGALVFNLPHLRLWLGTVSASDPLVPVRSGRLQQLFQTAFIGFLSRMCYRVDDRSWTERGYGLAEATEAPQKQQKQ